MALCVAKLAVLLTLLAGAPIAAKVVAPDLVLLVGLVPRSNWDTLNNTDHDQAAVVFLVRSPQDDQAALKEDIGGEQQDPNIVLLLKSIDSDQDVAGWESGSPRLTRGMSADHLESEQKEQFSSQRVTLFDLVLRPRRRLLPKDFPSMTLSPPPPAPDADGSDEDDDVVVKTHSMPTVVSLLQVFLQPQRTSKNRDGFDFETTMIAKLPPVLCPVGFRVDRLGKPLLG